MEVVMTLLWTIIPVIAELLIALQKQVFLMGVLFQITVISLQKE